MKKFTYKFDTNFKEVIQNCKTIQRNDKNGTWINEDVISAYCELHDLGVAHSVESYLDDKLVGGLYGVVIGRVFCGESMFAHKSDASKSAYAIFIKHLKEWGYEFIDCQVPTEHLKSLGAKEVSRDYFLERLNSVNFEYIDNKWYIDEDLIK